MLRIFRHYLSASALCLFACESGAVILVLFAALNMLHIPDLASGTGMGRSLSVVFVPSALNAFVMYSTGLYDRWMMEDFRKALPRLIAVFAFFTLVVILTMSAALTRSTSTSSVDALTYASVAATAFGVVVLARMSYGSINKATLPARRVLVVGVGKQAAEIEYLMSQRRHGTSEVVGYTVLANEDAEIPQSRIKPIRTSLLALARELGVKEIVVALTDRRGVPLQPLLEARMEGIAITSYLSYCERETRRVNLQALDPSWLIYSDGFRIGTLANVVLKRALDIAMSLAVLILTLPTMILAAIAVRLDSPGPILYRQERVGRNGVPFTIYKFRTMRMDAEGDGIPQWAAPCDPRITRVGSLLRMTRIDELPQILNVLRGDMSFVGPRPERPFFVESLSADIPFYSERHRVRPGITGWAQINFVYGASIEDAKVKLAYDLYYIKNYSFVFDLLIILSTFEAVFFKKGAR